MRYGASIIIIFILSCAGCSTDFAQNDARHNYVTSTQTQHQMSAVELVYGNGYKTLDGPSGSSLIQTVTLTAEYLEFIIDGRKVLRANMSMRKVRTILQLPPGQHTFEIYESSRGVLTLGFKSQHLIAKGSFSIQEGTTPSLYLIASYVNERLGHRLYYENFANLHSQGRAIAIEDDGRKHLVE